MTELAQGANGPVDGPAATLTVSWTAPSAAFDVDASAYLLTEAGKVRSDADMVFYNQPSGAGGAVTVQTAGAQATFAVALDRLPADVARIVFCVTINEAGAKGQTCAQLAPASIVVGPQGGAATLRYAPALTGAREAAMIFGELYRRQGQWKFRAVGQGFNGGLGPLARSFGIDVADEPAPTPTSAAPPAPAPAPGGRISLEKKVEAQAPRLVNLAKTAAVVLEKKKLSDVRAQVCLVLDRSGSMTGQYTKGRVQELLDRVLPLAAHFDDDGSLDVWAFGKDPAQLTPVTLTSIDGYIEREGGGWKSWPCGWVNDEPKVIEKVVAQFATASPPAYVIFVSDGGVSQNSKIEKLLRDAASKPIFWQFVGLGGARYGVLEALDSMRGRVVDNCGFFALDDLYDVTDAELYDRLLSEFPLWLESARKAGVLR